MQRYRFDRNLVKLSLSAEGLLFFGLLAWSKHQHLPTSHGANLIFDLKEGKWLVDSLYDHALLEYEILLIRQSLGLEISSDVILRDFQVIELIQTLNILKLSATHLCFVFRDVLVKS